jgi:hypothetical protein
VIHFTKVFFSKVLEGVSEQVDVCHDSACLWYLTQSCLQPIFIVPLTALLLYVLKRVAKRHVDGWGKSLVPWGVYSDDTHSPVVVLPSDEDNDDDENENELEPLAAKNSSNDEDTRALKDSLFFGSIQISWRRFWLQIVVWGIITLIASLTVGLTIFLPLHSYLIKTTRTLMDNLRCRPDHLEVIMVTFLFPLCIDILNYVAVDYIIKYKIRSSPSSSSLSNCADGDNTVVVVKLPLSSS